jgi:hypothetical protein
MISWPRFERPEVIVVAPEQRQQIDVGGQLDPSRHGRRLAHVTRLPVGARLAITHSQSACIAGTPPLTGSLRYRF